MATQSGLRPENAWPLKFEYLKAGELSQRDPAISPSPSPPTTTLNVTDLNANPPSVVMSITNCVAYTTLDVSCLRPTPTLIVTHRPILTRVLQTDAELSRLIGTLRLNPKVRTFPMTRDVKDERTHVVKDSENSSQDLSMTVLQTDDLPRGGVTSRPECQFHTNVCTESRHHPSLHLRSLHHLS